VGGPWAFVGTGATNSQIASNPVHSDTGSLHAVFTAAGGSGAAIIQQVVFPAPTNYHILSFWYYATVPSIVMELRLRPASTFRCITNTQIQIIPDRYVPEHLVTPAVVTLTPGTANAGTTNIDPSIPPLWINEVQPFNLTNIADGFSEHDPWIEIYNAGTNEVSLEGLYLSDNYTHLTNWAFPAGATIEPNAFIVIFADGQPGQSTATEWHTSFRLAATNGSVALARLRADLPEVLDYVNYSGVKADRSYGSYPDGQPFTRYQFYYATPGTNNNPTPVPLDVRINEWMASNTIYRDPTDLATDDWFELYNPADTPADLAGYYLGNGLTRSNQFEIPDGYVVPPRGHLLVWADNDSTDNDPDVPDLHVNFALNRGSDAIALFSPLGLVVDYVGWTTNQISNNSFGRYPDGAATGYNLTNPTPREANILVRTATSNSPPTLDAIADRSVTELSTLSFTATASDAESPAAITFSLASGAPSGAQIGLVNGIFTWTPSEAQGPGVYPIRVLVHDHGTPSMSATQSFTVTVFETNSAPTLGTIANRTVNESALVSFTAVGADPDLPANALTYSLEAGTATGAVINASSGAFSWTPNEAQGPGIYPMQVIVRDNATPSLNATQSFTITVDEVNSAPTLAPIADQVVTLGQSVSFTAAGTELDLPANSLVYALTGDAPTGAVIHATSGLFAWTPSPAQAGTNALTVQVTDDGVPPLSATRNLTITVVMPPTLTIRVEGATVSLSFGTLSGQNYQIQYADDVTSPVWNPVSGAENIAGTGASYTATDTLGSQTQRFYRVLLVE